MPLMSYGDAIEQYGNRGPIPEIVDSDRKAMKLLYGYANAGIIMSGMGKSGAISIAKSRYGDHDLFHPSDVDRRAIYWAAVDGNTDAINAVLDRMIRVRHSGGKLHPLDKEGNYSEDYVSPHPNAIGSLRGYDPRLHNISRDEGSYLGPKNWMKFYNPDIRNTWGLDLPEGVPVADDAYLDLAQSKKKRPMSFFWDRHLDSIDDAANDDGPAPAIVAAVEDYRSARAADPGTNVAMEYRGRGREPAYASRSGRGRVQF